MWVMCDPDPHVGCQLCLLWEWSAVPLPGMAQFGGGGRWWFSASPQELQYPFSVAQSPAVRVRVGQEASSSLHQSQLTFF
jgi:hypothetical protein